MKVDIQVPKMGESIVEATIGSILKPSGSFVKADEEILELETDKVNQVLYAPAAGTLQLTVKQGDVVKISQTIGSIDTSAPLPKEQGVLRGSLGEPAPEKPKPAAAAPPALEKSKPAAPPPPSTKSEMPPARVKADQYLAELSTPREEVKAPRVGKKESRKKMSRLRKVIAERLVEVKNQTAMLTTFNELDMSNVIQVREKEKESFEKKHGVRLGFMSFFIKACVSALQAFPDVNARIDKEEIVYPSSCDIGVAVATDKGLMVPVIRNAELLSYAEIEKTLKGLAEKARTGAISVDDLQGGTFTITNAGQFGSLFSTPILNPPQSGILGMHNIVKRPVVVDDQIAIRPMMYIALSYDHRVIDGKEAVQFLMHIKKNLEEPTRLLLDL